MDILERIKAHARGEKMFRLVVAPREEGYFFVNSPDMPGFSIMLRPGDIDSLDTLAGALIGPLEAFINAEYRACMRN